MKRSKLLILFIILFGFVALPNVIKADVKYSSLNFKETLAAEEMELEAKDYKETNDQITIYLFRGQGCAYCRAFLEFINSISPEYGKYFKMVSYEVWNNADNSTLLTDVSTFLGQPATGVPFIVIGEKYFAGYANRYDEDIKQAITDLYNTKKNKRYDVMKKMKKSGGLFETSDQVWLIIICNFVFITVASLMIMSHFNKKYNELYEKIASLNNDKISKPKVNKKQK